jgi:malonate-semialdehyde dehydrogenase (acetylating)/methylmalonate-semialdehyde dehydrogenase
MAISALVVVEPVADELASRIKPGWASCASGTASAAATWAHWSPARTETVLPATSTPESRRAPSLVVDGRNPTVDADGEIVFLEPTLLDKVSPEMSIYKDETFGPVLSALRTASYADGLALINSNPYGNGTAIFTSGGGAAPSSKARSRSAWSARQRADPGAGLLLLVRLEEQPLR